MTVKEQSYQVIHADEDVLSKHNALNKSQDLKSERRSQNYNNNTPLNQEEGFNFPTDHL